MQKRSLVCLLAIALVSVGGAQAASAATKKKNDVRDRGLWLEAKLGGALSFWGYASAFSASPALAIGYKLGRLVLAAEVGFSIGDTEHAGAEHSTRGWSVLITPRIQYHVWQRGPVVTYATVGAGARYDWWRWGGSQGIGSHAWSLRILAGLGVRYFAHPRFAFSFELGAQAGYGREKSGLGDFAVSRSWSAGLYSSLGAAVIF